MWEVCYSCHSCGSELRSGDSAWLLTWEIATIERGYIEAIEEQLLRAYCTACRGKLDISDFSMPEKAEAISGPNPSASETDQPSGLTCHSCQNDIMNCAQGWVLSFDQIRVPGVAEGKITPIVGNMVATYCRECGCRLAAERIEIMERPS